MNLENENLEVLEIEKVKKEKNPFKPTAAFIGVSWIALFAGIISFNVGLWNATMAMVNKGYYIVVLLFGLFSVVSVQKNVRDKLEDIQISEIYFGISWMAILMAIMLLIVGLWNADLTLSEKGFYSMSYALSLFAAIAVQKNVRDVALHKLEK